VHTAKNKMSAVFIRSVPWRVPDYFERRFYDVYANVVGFVVALHKLGWPDRVYDELLLWTGVGRYLFLVDRMRAIGATLASCRRMLAERQQRPHNDQRKYNLRPRRRRSARSNKDPE